MAPDSDDLVIRPYEPGDEQGILETFNLVFREVCGEGYRDRTPAEWAWQYLENPRGMRVMLAVAPEGTVAAQYAAVPMAVLSPLGPTSFVHAVDSMVHPAFRPGLKKPGLFVPTGQDASAPFSSSVARQAPDRFGTAWQSDQPMWMQAR